MDICNVVCRKRQTSKFYTQKVVPANGSSILSVVYRKKRLMLKQSITAETAVILTLLVEHKILPRTKYSGIPI